MKFRLELELDGSDMITKWFGSVRPTHVSSPEGVVNAMALQQFLAQGLYVVPGIVLGPELHAFARLLHVGTPQTHAVDSARK